MLESGIMREDLKLPEGDLGKDIQEKFDNGDTFMVSSLPYSCKTSSHW